MDVIHVKHGQRRSRTPHKGPYYIYSWRGAKNIICSSQQSLPRFFRRRLVRLQLAKGGHHMRKHEEKKSSIALSASLVHTTLTDSKKMMKEAFFSSGKSIQSKTKLHQASAASLLAVEEDSSATDINERAQSWRTLSDRLKKSNAWSRLGR